MTVLPHHYVILAVIVFTIGTVGVLTRKNLFIVLLSVELMLNSANLALVAFSKMHAHMAGHIIVMFSIAIAAAEVSIGLALIIALYRLHDDIGLDVLTKLRG